MSRPGLSQDYALAHLFRRFEKTIPLRRPIVVKHRDIMNTRDVETEGLPMHCRPHVLYVMTHPGHCLGIPKSAVIDIRARYPQPGPGDGLPPASKANECPSQIT